MIIPQQIPKLEQIRVVAINEESLVFDCSGESLFGVLHIPEVKDFVTGVLIVVGGPQYRVGSHRQFVQLARGLAKQGIPVFRFDCRGMGDSTGKFQGFENIEDDIRSAVDLFMIKMPSLQKLVIWGLCDGATAAGFYAPNDSRIVGLCLANPWVRTEQGEAEAFVKHYYFARLLSKDFWVKLFSGKIQVLNSFIDFSANVRRSFFANKDVSDGSREINNHNAKKIPLPAKLFRDLTRFSGELLFVISGNDLTAAEFLDSAGKDSERKKLMESSRVNRVYVPDADHTFSRRVWIDDVVNKTAVWVKSI